MTLETIRALHAENAALRRENAALVGKIARLEREQESVSVPIREYPWLEDKPTRRLGLVDDEGES